MRIPLFAGRDFTWNDTKASGLKIVLNQSAAKLLAPDGNVLGRMVKNRDGDKTVLYQVVGVVGDAKYEDLRAAAPPGAYVPMTQERCKIAVVSGSGAHRRARLGRSLLRRARWPCRWLRRYRRR